MEKINKINKKDRKISLTTRIFIALAAGLIVGVSLKLFVPAGFVRDRIVVEGVFYVVGNGFIRLMKMLVVPMVFCSLVCGVSSMSDQTSFGKIGIKSIVFYLCTTAIAVAIAIGIALIVNPGSGLDMSSISVEKQSINTGTVSIADTLLNIIPNNPFEALSSGNMLQIIFFAMLVGYLIVKMGKKGERVGNTMQLCNDFMMSMTELVMLFAPIGVFCMIARTFVGLGYEGFLPLLKYMGTVLGGLLVHCVVIYMLMLFVFARLNPVRFLKKIFPVMAFAFSTSSSNAVIPMNIDTLEEKMGVNRKISSFTIPLGATINMDGTAIMQGVAVVFAAQAYGIDIGVSGYLTVILSATLASIGTAGVPSVGLITLSMVFASVGLPVEAIAIIMGVDRVLDMVRTAVNITGDAVCTTIVASQSGLLDKKIFYQNKK